MRVSLALLACFLLCTTAGFAVESADTTETATNAETGVVATETETTAASGGQGGDAPGVQVKHNGRNFSAESADGNFRVRLFGARGHVPEPALIEPWVLREPCASFLAPLPRLGPVLEIVRSAPQPPEDVRSRREEGIGLGEVLSVSEAPFTMGVMAENASTALEVAEELFVELADIEGLVDLRMDRVLGSPNVVVRLNRPEILRAQAKSPNSKSRDSHRRRPVSPFELAYLSIRIVSCKNDLHAAGRVNGLDGMVDPVPDFVECTDR